MARTQHIWKPFSWVMVPVVLAACKPTLDDLTVWKTQLTSPDGQWIASARTIQNGGFGSGDISTVVYLNRKDDANSPQEIVDFDGGSVAHTYVLDNVANRGGGIDLVMRWAAPTHLMVTYRSSPTIYFQVVKFQNIEITTLHLPADAQSGNASP